MPRRSAFVVLALAVVLAWAAPLILPSTPVRAQGQAPDMVRVRPNYELASRWTASKVNNKLVFSVSVTPNWFATGDRFWYTFSTSKGPRWMLVDTVKRSKAPLFDTAVMAAQLTNIVRVPFDSGHLPSSVRLIKKDAVLQFEVAVPKDTRIPGIVEKGEDKETTEVQGQQGGGRGGPPPGAAAAPTGPTRNLRFEYELATAKLTLVHPDEVRAQAEKDKEVKWPSWASVSPDEKTAIFVRNFDLYMMDAENLKKAIKDPRDASIVETRLTQDGAEHYTWSRHVTDEEKDRLRKEQKKEEEKKKTEEGKTEGKKTEEKKAEEKKAELKKAEEKDTFEPRVSPIGVVWSQDSKKFTGERRDSRKVKDLWVIDALAQPRPKLETYRYSMPGEDIPLEDMCIFDVPTRQRSPVKCDAFKDQRLTVAMRLVTDKERKDREGTPNPLVSPQWALAGSDAFLMTRQSRDLKRLDIVRVDTKTGEVKTLVEERMNTYIDTRPIRVLEGEQEFLWWSERDGWGHWYLYGIDGTLKNQVTKGEFVTGNIAGVDGKTRTLYVTANAREAGEDPYYEHLYRVGLDGNGMKLLNPGDANHVVAMPDHARMFVDTATRVDQAPKSVLRDSLGNQVVELEATDTSLLCEQGYKFPEPFIVKADDGVTDLAGVMYKPHDFDPKKKYPIIAYVYPGPQTESVSKTFNAAPYTHWLAQFGFIVIEVGNRGGTPARSKWYHNYGYGNLRDYGLADKKSAIEQLARKHAFIDINKVGIYGHSGGGFMSTAAMLVYPDFFKVAVSSAGNHENNIYNDTWSEKHHGIKEVEKDGKVTFEYNIDKNSEIAKNLKGKLLLAHGDIDNNVHPANTIRVVDALIKANKRFDLVIIPGSRHGMSTDWWNWTRAEYFCKHLLGEANDGADMVELSREQAQRGERRARPDGGEEIIR
jgi:dipeptidyl aminopeptidase/acylaminoacyl peptidase